jgi:hypothetical protein
VYDVDESRVLTVLDVRSRTCKRNGSNDVVLDDDRHSVYIRVQVWIHYFKFRGEYDVYLSSWLLHQGGRNMWGVLAVHSGHNKHQIHCSRM